jgi:hypothetical protein
MRGRTDNFSLHLKIEMKRIFLFALMRSQWLDASRETLYHCLIPVYFPAPVSLNPFTARGAP